MNNSNTDNNNIVEDNTSRYNFNMNEPMNYASLIIYYRCWQNGHKSLECRIPSEMDVNGLLKNTSLN